MPFSVAFALLGLVIVLIIFLVVNRAYGPGSAVAASRLALLGLLALFVAVTTFITLSMP